MAGWVGSPLRQGMKRVLFVNHVSRILGGAEINLLELLASTSTDSQWITACACPAEGPLGQALRPLGLPLYHYALPPGLNSFRLVDRRFDFKGALRSLRALSAAREQLHRIVETFSPDAVVSCTNKDHFAAASVC
ncbi:MAG: hypothetical protein HYZ36_05590, partial [Pedosphaera parvula]|nr:hypothetical protein [Pedosphaera parvula]